MKFPCKFLGLNLVVLVGVQTLAGCDNTPNNGPGTGVSSGDDVGSVLVGRTGTVAGSARTVIGLVVPLTVIDGQTR